MADAITLTYTASGNNLARARSSSWTKGDGAYQGSYGGNAPYCGVMRWPTLRDTVVWGDQIITKITLALTYAKAGGTGGKTLYLYRAKYNSYTGSPAGMCGTAIGAVGTNGGAYNATRTITFDQNTNAAAFANLADWITNGTTYALAVYHNESSSSGHWSGNYLKITSARLQVTYEPSSSRGSLDRSSADVNTDVTVTVDPAEVEGEVTHSVVWSCGSATVSRTLESGALNDTLTIPYSWLEQFRGYESAAASCAITTLVDGEQRGDPRVIPFTVTSGAKPRITAFSVARYATRLNDQGEWEDYESFVGGNVWFTVDAGIPTDSPTYRTGSAYILYGYADSTARTRLDLTWSGSSYAATRSKAISAAISLDRAWVFELYVSDGNSTVTQSVRVEKSTTPVHIAGNGAGVCFGGFSSATPGNPLTESQWPSRLRGINVYGTDEIKTGGTWIDGSDIYMKTLAYAGSMSAGGTYDLPIGTDVDRVARLSGFAYAEGWILPLPFAHNSDPAYNISVSVVQEGTDGGYVRLTLGSGRTGITGGAQITVEYTK